MQVLRTISVAAMIAMLGAAGAQAQSLRKADEPAEFPPSSFKGSQYVDSRGCIYVRAGQGGAVQWIPRVSRDRRVLCGFKPTLANAEENLPVIPDPVAPASTETVAATPDPAAQAPTAQAPAASAQTVAAAPASTQATPATQARPNPFAISYTPSPVAPKPAPTVAAKPVPAPKPISSFAGKTVGERGCVADAAGAVNCESGQNYVLKRVPAGVKIRTADGQTLTTSAPTLVRVAVKRAPTPMKVPAQAAAPAQNIEYAAYTPTAPQYAAAAQPQDCAALGAATAAYMQARGKFGVRCGPQAVHPSSYARNGYAPQNGAGGYAPAQVARVSTKMNYAIPHPQKIHVPKGYRPAWSDGRINPYRGAPTYAGDLQQGRLWTQTSPAYGVNYPRRMTFWEWLFDNPAQIQKTTVRAAPKARDDRPAPSASTRVSLKSAAPSKTPVAQAAPKAAPAGLRYVQVGTFGVPENAQRSISRLSAMGFPVSSQKLTRNGRSYKIVLAGPFAQPEHTMSALGQVRAAGYGDAFARK